MNKQLSVVFLIIALLAAICITFAHEEEKQEYRPPRNAVPELYPEIYTGFGGEQAPHGVVPTEFNWCQHHRCSPRLQQHIQYTPLCFLHASLHMLNDRMNYAIEQEPELSGAPAVYLSRADYLEHAHLIGLSDNPMENGGEGVDVLEWAKRYGIPDETCNPWKSDPEVLKTTQSSDMTNRCRNCMMLKNDKLQHCWPVENFVKYRVKDYNFVRGELEMMNEIFQRGPIQCGLVVDDEMIYNYAGGVYNDYGRCSNMEIDHDVVIYGWGSHYNNATQKEESFWIASNSWGTNLFGTNGFFLINKGNNTLRVEERCLWATPDVSELKTHMTGQNVGTMFGLKQPGAKPQLLPDDWEKSQHDYYTDKELEEGAKEAQKQDKWFAENIYTPEKEAIREKQNADIIVKDQQSSITTFFTWLLSLTGVLFIALIIAIVAAVWLYCNQSPSDGYEPIPDRDYH